VRVLVTGAAGLVGTHVLDALRSRGEQPPARALVREHSRAVVEAFGADAIVGDVTDQSTWQRASQGVDAIIHGAALVASHDSFDEFTHVNVGGTRLAIEAARRAGARLIHISTVAVYGRAEVTRRAHEASPRTIRFSPFRAPTSTRGPSARRNSWCKRKRRAAGSPSSRSGPT